MDQQEADYYRQAIEQRLITSEKDQPCGIEVVYTDATRGKIVRATRHYEPNEIVWIERPLCGMTHLQSSKYHRGCDECGRPIGTIQEEWQRCTGILAAEAAKKNKKKKGAGVSSKKKQTDTNSEAATTTSSIAQELPLESDIQWPDELPFGSKELGMTTGSTNTASSATATTATMTGSSIPSQDAFQSISCSAIPCEGGCSAGYCSIECRSTASHGAHSLLCRCDALMKHAQTNNEIFLLAAKGVADMLLQALKNIRQCQEISIALDQSHIHPSSHPLTFALQLHHHLTSLPSHEANVLRQHLQPCVSRAIYPYQRFCGGVWSDEVPLPSSVDPDDEADYRESLCGLVEQSLQLVQEQFDANLQSAANESASAVPIDVLIDSLKLDDIFSLSLYNRVLSSFELNNIGFHAPTMLGLYVTRVNSLSTEEHDAVIARLTHDVWTAMQQRVSTIGTNLEGTGLFTIGCCMNHSCDPNITLLQKSELSLPSYRTPSNPSAAAAADLPLTERFTFSAVFIALRPIEPGDELNISYIDLVRPVVDSSSEGAASTNDMVFERIPTEERRAALQPYGFTCTCSECDSNTTPI